VVEDGVIEDIPDRNLRANHNEIFPLEAEVPE
jgi:hypothetical protein